MNNRFAALTAFIVLLTASGFAFKPSGANVSPLQLPPDMPVVFMDPMNATADLGDEITVNVKVFNLSDNFYVTDVKWEPGESLGPPGTQYNYSLGNLYGLDIRLSWNPSVLQYQNHTVKIPVENYTDGVLHEPTFNWLDEVNVTAGTYNLTELSLGPAEEFNCPDKNATFFAITFNVTAQGAPMLNLDRVRLSRIYYPDDPWAPMEIPHRQITAQIIIIPEFPSISLILPLLLTATLFIVIFAKKSASTIQ